LRAAWGSYGSALWVSCLMAGLGAIAIAGLRDKRREDESAPVLVGAPVPEHKG
jgi:hypothetical protein